MKSGVGVDSRLTLANQINKSFKTKSFLNNTTYQWPSPERQK